MPPQPSDSPAQPTSAQPAPGQSAPTVLAAPAPAGYISNPFELIKPTLQGFALNWPQYLGLIGVFVGPFIIGILIGVLGLAAAGGGAGASLWVILPILLILAYCALIIWLTPGVYRLLTAMARHEKFTLREAVTGNGPYVWKLFGSHILAGLAVLGGLLLFVIPGIIFAVWFSLVPYVVVNEGLSGPAALRRSRELVRHRALDVLGVLSLGSAVNILAIIPILGPLAALCLGIALTPVTALRYVQLHALTAVSDGRDVPTSPLNWAVLALALVAIIVTSARDSRDLERLQHYSNPANSLEKNVQPY